MEDKMSDKLTHESEDLTLSKIFHEIKNPLTLINSSLQLIESDHPEVKTFRFWNQTIEDLRELRYLLEDLSSYHNVGSLKFSHLSAYDFAEDLLDGMEAFLLETGIPLTLKTPDRNFFFYADSLRLRQAIVNLLKNAVESSPAGSPVELGISTDGQNLNITVSDHGCGISRENLEKLFVPFHTTKEYGTGLGLPVVKRIVESHLGKITVQSAENQGTSFLIRIPLDPR